MMAEPKSGMRWERDIAESEAGAGFFENGIVRALLTTASVPIAALFGVLVYFIRPTENLIILHYNAYFGVDMLGVWWQVYFLPLLAFLFLASHVLLARYFYSRSERIAAYLLLLSAGWLSVGLSIAGMTTAFINY